MIRSAKLLGFLLLLFFAGTTLASDSLNVFRQLSDPLLERDLSRVANGNAHWKKLIEQKNMAICLVDLSGSTPRFASINGDHMMYAASLPKIAILLAAYVSFEDGSLVETAEIKQDLADMIRVSSNSAATRMIDRIGMRRIQAILQSPEYGFYNKADGGGLWVGKRFAAEGIRRGDPLYNISHGATADQVCRFFYLASTKQLINQERSEQILNDLADPKLHHKFVSQTDVLAPKAMVYRKSGSWRRWHADAVLVQGEKWRNYILVGLVEHKDGERIIRSLLPAVEAIIKPDTPAQTK